MGVVVSQLIAEVSIRGADQAQTSLRDVGSATTTLQDKLNTIKPYNAGNSVTDVDVAQAKLTLLEEKVAQARDKMMTLQNAANAGEAVTGLPEAEANLVLLQDKAQQARAGLEELKAGAVDAGEGMQTLKQGAAEAEEATGGGFLSAIKETAGGMVDFVGKIGMGVMSAQMIWGTVKNVTTSLIQAAEDNQQAQAQTVAAFKSTGDASGMTVASISNLADSLSQVTAFSKDTVQGGENLLLTFTGIGKDVFPDTTKAMLDLSQATGQDMKSSAMQLGKALNDPLTGMAALSRVGVNFNAQEKEQIKTMMAHNDVAGAQKVMLKELETEFGGSAEAAGKTFGGALDILKNRLEDVKVKIGTAALPVLTNFLSALSSPAVASFSDSLEKDVVSAFSHVGQGVKYVGEVLHSLNLSDFKDAWHTVSFEVKYTSDKFKELGSHLTAAKGDFDPLADAIAGIAKVGLKGVTDLLWDFSQAFILVDKAAQDGSGPLAGFVNQAKQVGGSLLSISPGVTLIQVLIKHSQDLAKWWQSSVIPAFRQAEPGFANLGQALAGLLPVIEHIASVVHDVLQHAFEAMLPVFEKAVPIIIKIAGILSDGLGSAIKFLTPYIQQAIDAIGKFAGEIVDRVAPIVSKWLDNLNHGIDGFMAVWKVVWPYASQILKGIWDEIMGIVKIAWAIVSGIIKIGLDLLSGNWKKAWTDFQDMLKGIWEGIKQYLSGAWEIIKGIFSGALKGIQTIFGNIGGWFHDRFSEIVDNAGKFKNSVIDHFNDLKNNASSIFRDMINFVVDRLNDGISAVEGFVNNFGGGINTVAEKLGAGDIIPSAHLPRIPHYAAGTPASGHPGGPMVVGENGPELLVAPKGTSVLPAGQTQALLKAFGIPGYAGGVGDALGDFFSWIGGGAKSVLDNVLSALHIGAPSLPGALNDMASGILSKVKDVAVDWIGKHMPHFDFGGGSGGSPVNIPGNLQAWITAAMALTHVPGSWAGPLAAIAMHESGGDPNAINNWDSNAAAGDPSRGLMQTIGSTFAAYALPGYNSNIFDPIQNTAASIQYIKATYGSVFNVPGIQSMAGGNGYVGYANGGVINEPITGIGLHTGTRYAFGERGPETVIPNGVSIGSSNIGSNISNREVLARLDRIATLLEKGLSLDGQRVSNVLLPSLISEIRSRTGARF